MVMDNHALGRYCPPLQKEKPRGNAATGRIKCSCSLAPRYCRFCNENPNKRDIEITSPRSSEFTSEIIIDGVRYHVQTEKLSMKKKIIITIVSKDGKIISSKKIDYNDLQDDADSCRKLSELMHRQHMSAIKMLKEENPRMGKLPSSYLDDVKGLLKARNHEGAFKMLRTALGEHPFDPFILSYYGCLDAIVNKNYDQGIDVCKDAIDILKEDVPFGKEVYYPLFYLNLGRAYLVRGDKGNAAEAFKKGLEADPQDSDLLGEVGKIGMRKKPVVPILKRSNPINKYIGRLLHKPHL
jgi:tetratricopeptide (TPR) repeat protein